MTARSASIFTGSFKAAKSSDWRPGKVLIYKQDTAVYPIGISVPSDLIAASIPKKVASKERCLAPGESHCGLRRQCGRWGGVKLSASLFRALSSPFQVLFKSKERLMTTNSDPWRRRGLEI